MDKEMVDTIKEYVRLKLYKTNNSLLDIKALLIIHQAIWKIKIRMEGRTSEN